jgi:hypothetical protein
MIVPAALVLLTILIIKAPKLVRARRWGSLALLCSALAAACALCLLLVSQLSVESPRKAVENVINALQNLP